MNNRLKFEENYFKKMKFQECKGDPKSSWKTLKSILNWQSSGSPSKLFYKGELKTKDRDIADSQNEYFVEKIKNLRNELPQQKDDPCIILQNLMKNRNCSMMLTSVHPDDVLKIISDLPNSTAFGLDNIDTYIIKLIKHEITPVITHIINLSIATGTFPNNWKNSKIILLYKNAQIFK